MSTTIPTIEEQIDQLKTWIADLVRRMATVNERRREAWLAAVRAYREKLQQLSSNIQWVVRDALWSKIPVAQAPWAPQPRVTAPQLGLAYPLRTQHPVLGNIPYVQSLATELTRMDMRYLDMLDAIVEGHWKLVYKGEEYRPTTTAHMSSCTRPEMRGNGYFCITEPVDGRHKCIKFFTDHECAVHSSTVSIPDENCDVTIIVFEGHEYVVGCLSDYCCDPMTTSIGDLDKNTDYDFMASVPIARVYIQNGCSDTALLITEYGNVAVRPNTSRNLIVAQYRGMRDACTFEMG